MSKLKFLTPEQKKCWQENGYVKLTDVFSPKEFKEIDDEYNHLFSQKQKESGEGLEAAWIGDDMKKLSSNRKVTVQSIHNLQMHSAVFTRLLMNNNLLDALEDALDTKDILLHHTKAHIKPPEKGAPYLMHQDYPYFPYKKHTMLAVFVHLDDTTPENGGLCIYPGSHKLGPLPFKTLIDDKGDKYHYVDPEKYPLSGATPVTAKKGEVIFFSYLTLHGSYLNTSTRPRRMFLAQIRAADDEPTENIHNSHCQGLVLRGRNPFMDAKMENRFVKHYTLFIRLLMNNNLLDAIEDALDTKDILLHHTKAHIKPTEKGSPYLMYQDYPYFPYKKHTMLAVFVHLDDTTPENGGLCIYPGSHKLGPLPFKTLIDDKGDKYHYVDPEKYPLSGATPVTAKKGEVIFFSYLTLHGSYLNTSTRPRRMFLAQIRAADDEPTENIHNSYCQGLVLRGRNPFMDATMENRFVKH